MPGPLEGIIVLDFTWHLAGPYGSMQLADLGAEVWKIETVYADEKTRGPGPIVDGINTYFFSVNRGKHSLAINVKTEAGREIGAEIVDAHFTNPKTLSQTIAILLAAPEQVGGSGEPAIHSST